METVKQRESIQAAVDAAKEEGFPTNVEEKEAYFMDQVQIGDSLSQDREFSAPTTCERRPHG